jgi:phospholipase/carboxylesterase
MNKLDFVHRYQPSATGDNSRVLLLLHGTGGDESDLISLGLELDPAAALLSPRGKVSENGSTRFFRRFAEGVFDEADVIRRANELADFVTSAAENYGFELRQLVAVGYSNGANIAAAMMLLRPEILAAAILFRAMVVLSNPPSADLSGKRVLISAGRNDPIIPLENVQRLATLLKNAGSEVSLEVQQASHGLVQEDVAAAKRWLKD